jgi:Tol biopolymer transport system component
MDRSDGLWIMKVDAGKVARVADGPFTSPAWSPDGSRLAFDRRRNDIWMIKTKELEKLWDVK